MLLVRVCSDLLPSESVSFSSSSTSPSQEEACDRSREVSDAQRLFISLTRFPQVAAEHQHELWLSGETEKNHIAYTILPYIWQHLRLTSGGEIEYRH